MDIEDLTTFASSTADEARLQLAQVVGNNNPNLSFVLTMLETSSGNFVQVPFHTSPIVPEYVLQEVELVSELLEPNLGNVQIYTIKRGKTTIGHLFYSHKDAHKFDLTPAGLLPFVFNRRQHERFSRSLNAPVPFDVTYDEFFAHLKELARDASASTHGAYRNLNNDRLECLFQWGFQGVVESCSELSLDVDLVPQFLSAIEDATPIKCWSLKMECPELVELQKFQNNVASFCAIPVEVGERVVGLLTIGTSTEYDFTAAEENAFRCISNGIGVAISNYKNHWRGKKFQDDFEEIASSVNALEVVHQIKHNIIDNSGMALTNISLMSDLKVPRSKMTSSEKDGALELLAVAKKQIRKVDDDIRHIGEVISFDRMLEQVSVRDLWEEVQEHLSHRIKDIGVSVSEIGKGQPRIVISGAVKHIFQNLMLNSLDAFKYSSRSDKKITLAWESQGHQTRIWKLRYSDNGPGLPVEILKQQIRQASSHPLSDLDPDTPVGEYIFLPKVTSKAEGTGQGLFLSRNMANQHLGGIEYNNRSNDGVSFDLEICFDLQRVFSSARRPIYYKDRDGYKRQLTDVSAYLAARRKGQAL